MIPNLSVSVVATLAGGMPRWLEFFSIEVNRKKALAC